MPDHFHVLITPKTSLERAVQFIKGGFSFRAKKELGTKLEIWQRGFSDHRIRDVEDYVIHRKYIHNNPVKKHFCVSAERYPYSSAFSGYVLDGEPQRLKPLANAASGAPEGAPFQSQARAEEWKG
jgi:putative transposase